MEIKTFRAKTMQQALHLVRQELGAEATVLHTRELNTGLVSRFLRGQEYEIAASAEMAVPQRMVQPAVQSKEMMHPVVVEQVASIFEAEETTFSPMQPMSTDVAGPSLDDTFRPRFQDDFQQDSGVELSGAKLDNEVDELHELAEQLRERTNQKSEGHLPGAMFQIYTDMIEADIEESAAQELVNRLRNTRNLDVNSTSAVRTELERMLESELKVAGPIEAEVGQGRVIALVGPTGVGKTTTIAKLAANYRLRENKRVGLITVDTYRIAAVEQLRTYAEIIDLPMEIVSTPREMREAINRMSDLDLILMDTAGRSPRDEVKIQELKSILAEAEPDEVHLVLSAVGGVRSLVTTAERFATVGTTAMLITKLDEATVLGNLLSITRNCGLPISYMTDGQNVPDDIQVAKPLKLAQLILGD